MYTLITINESGQPKMIQPHVKPAIANMLVKRFQAEILDNIQRLSNVPSHIIDRALTTNSEQAFEGADSGEIVEIGRINKRVVITRLRLILVNEQHLPYLYQVALKYRGRDLAGRLAHPSPDDQQLALHGHAGMYAMEGYEVSGTIH